MNFDDLIYLKHKNYIDHWGEREKINEILKKALLFDQIISKKFNKDNTFSDNDIICVYKYIIIYTNYEDLINFIKNKNINEVEYMYILTCLFDKNEKMYTLTFNTLYIHKIKLFLDKFKTTEYFKFYKNRIIFEINNMKKMSIEDIAEWTKYFNSEEEVKKEEISEDELDIISDK